MGGLYGGYGYPGYGYGYEVGYGGAATLRVTYGIRRRRFGSHIGDDATARVVSGPTIRRPGPISAGMGGAPSLPLIRGSRARNGTVCAVQTGHRSVFELSFEDDGSDEHVPDDQTQKAATERKPCAAIHRGVHGGLARECSPGSVCTAQPHAQRRLRTRTLTLALGRMAEAAG